jgi:protein tyrosine/serine phosphatase
MRLPAKMRPLIYVIVCAPILLGSIYVLGRDNFHTVVTGEVYRSAQLSADSLEQYALENNIRSILNLRGASPQKEWYQAEKALSNRLNISHHDISLRAYELPSLFKIKELLEIMDQILKPYLIHCEGGADRTGLVSSLLLLLEGNQSLSQIEEQVSWKYLAFKEKSAGKQFFYQYKSWLEANARAHTASQFSDWLETSYMGDNGDLGFYIDIAIDYITKTVTALANTQNILRLVATGQIWF